MTDSSEITQESIRFVYQPGDVVAGKYTLEALLGEGGMGSVYRARNAAIDLPVAIKLLRADLNGATFRSRLLQEARATARLQHPAITRVFDVGQTTTGEPFIVMELLQGETLARLLTRVGRLPPQEAVALLLPIAEGLAAVHAMGFVHRDVKPDNIFIAESDGRLQPKLVDFGIVKLDSFDRNGRLTQVGAVLGSPEYMSPEQAQGREDVDQRSDVWSFSVALYEAITGFSPFHSPNYHALLRMIIEQDPPPMLGEGIGELGALVARGLSKNPADRFASMTEYGRALADWLAAQGRTSDACGVSLDAHWLDRSDPMPLVRVSNPRPAAPDAALRHHTTSVSPVARSTPPSAKQSLGTFASAAVMVSVLFVLGFTTLPHVMSPPSAQARPASTDGLGTGLVTTSAAAVLRLPERTAELELARPNAAPVTTPITSTVAISETAPAPAPAAKPPTQPRAGKVSSIWTTPKQSKASSASGATNPGRGQAKPTSTLVRTNPYIDLMAPY